MSDIYKAAKELETELWNSTLRNDSDKFLDMVAEDAVMVCGGYRCLGKEYAEYIKTEPISSYKFIAFEVIQATSELLQVHYVVQVFVDDERNSDFAGKFHVTSTWKKDNQKYKLVFNMDSRIIE